MMQRNRQGGPVGMKRMPNPGQGLLGSAPGMPPVGGPNLLPGGQGMPTQNQTPLGNNGNLNGLGMGNLGMTGNAHFGKGNTGNGNFGSGNAGNVSRFGNNPSVGFGNSNNKPFLPNSSNVGFANSNAGFSNSGGLRGSNNVGFGSNNAMMGGSNGGGFPNAGMGTGNTGMGNGMMQRNQQVSGLLGNIPSQMLGNNMNMNTNALNPDSMNAMADGLPSNQLDSQLSLVNSLLKGNLMSGMNNAQNAMTAMNMAGPNGNGGSSGMNSMNSMGMPGMAAGNNNNMNLMQQMNMGAAVSNQMTGMSSPTGSQQPAMFASNPVMGQQMNPMISQKHQMSMRVNEYSPDAKRMRLDNQGLLGSHPPGPPPLTQGHSSLSMAVRPGFGQDLANRGRSIYTDYQQHSRRHSRDSRDSSCSRGGGDRRSVYDARDGHSSPGRREYGWNEQLDSGQEEYDPAQPTDEVAGMDVCSLSGSWNSPLPSQQQHRRGNQDGGHRNLLLEHSMSPSTTQDQYRTIKQDCRNVGHDLSITIDNKMTADGQDHKKESMPDQNKTQYFCHACNVDCLTLKNFENHMESSRHKLRIDEVLHLHMQKTSQLNDRLRAEVHLRNIENDDKRNDYCNTCDKKFYGHVINHRRSQEHKRKERLTKRGCRLCETGSFSKYPDYVLHIDSQSHKKKKALLRKDDQHDDDQSCDEDDGVAVDMCEMVTVDATGIFEDEDAAEAHGTSKLALQSVSHSSLGSEGHVQDSTDTQQEAECRKGAMLVETSLALHANVIMSDENMRENKCYMREACDPPGTHDINAACYITDQNSQLSNVGQPGSEKGKSEVIGKAQNISLVQKTEKFIDSDSSKENDSFDPQVPVGQEYVIPVSGFFCRLCNKFYNDENTAKVRHCQSRLHFDKYQSQKNSKTSHLISRKILQADNLDETQRLRTKENGVSLAGIEETISNNNDKETGIIQVNVQINGVHDASLSSTQQACLLADNKQLSDNSSPSKCPMQCIDNVTVTPKSAHSVLIPNQIQGQDSQVQ